MGVRRSQLRIFANSCKTRKSSLQESNYDLYHSLKQNEVQDLANMLDTARGNKQLYCNDALCSVALFIKVGKQANGLTELMGSIARRPVD